MRIYLDNCALNRPFDDQGQVRVRLEAEAKLYIQEQIRAGLLDVLWSYMLDSKIVQIRFRNEETRLQDGANWL